MPSCNKLVREGIPAIYAVSPHHGSYMEELERVRLAKREERGGFEKGYYLIEVED